ncbi:hypothetical protein HNQ93_001256 [Hymenobacter luteus]|uniref:Phage integrase SAM-like domain-containing protein n=2 Tax=Hymenobacter TaxID=89966 RepID=A0A7W9SZV0_9BACT|nr:MULTISPECIES: phage integrase SAM-like domain-containing protein [Hymenobacter]MBB4601383.1 hypothetical protein [Hymenobacter latericoloratus]MBB6058410.1 hypothetical protein [Hymenobacter luteus]
MATVSTLVRVKNKKKAENPLWVILRHKNSDGTRLEVAISTGENIDPSELKRGKVVGDKSIALNELVTTISGELYKAFEIVLKRGEAVTAALVRTEYDRIVADRLLEEKRRLFFRKSDEYAKNQKIYNTKKYLRRIDEEIQERLQWKENNQRRLDELEGNISTLESTKKDLLVTYFQRFLDEKRNNLKRNSSAGYVSIMKMVEGYSKTLRIQDVNRTIMYELEDYMIQKKLSNTSIENYTSKIKGILNYFVDELNLGTSYKGYTFKLPIYANDVVYLSLEQLQDFWKYEKAMKSYEKQPNRTTPKGYQRVKDLFMFMCGTSLRFVDIFVNFRELIQVDTDRHGNTTEYIVMTPQKTQKKQIRVKIPVTPLVKSILVRNDYQFKPMRDDYFRDLLREFCEDIPSFQQEVTWFDFQGQEKVPYLDPKTRRKPLVWQELGSHTGRRTWINMAIQSGYTIPEVMGVTGHTEMNTLALYFSKAKVTRDKPLNFFNNVEQKG